MAEVRAASQTELASPVDVSVRVQGDTFGSAPSGDVMAAREDSGTEFMSEYEAAAVDLWKIGGVKVAAADAAQVYLDQDLVRAGLGYRSLSEHELAFFVQQNRWHHLSHWLLLLFAYLFERCRFNGG